LHQTFRAIHELTVEPTIHVSTNPTTRYGLGRFINIPICKRGTIEHVLMSAPDDDNGVLLSRSIKVITVWQSLLVKLSFMPITICDDHITRRCFLSASRDCTQDFL
jgi:hypothetical protein